MLSSALPIEIFGGLARQRLGLLAEQPHSGNGAKDPENQGFLRSPDHLMPADTFG